jgi:hypothetical protein
MDGISNLTLGILQLIENRSPGIPNSIPSIRQLTAEIAQSSESGHVDISSGLMLLPPHVTLNMAHYRFPRGHYQQPVQDEIRPAGQKAAR